MKIRLTLKRCKVFSFGVFISNIEHYCSKGIMSLWPLFNDLCIKFAHSQFSS